LIASFLEHLPKKGISQSKEQLEDKEEDKNNKTVFTTSKLRMWVECDCCGARHCIYSKYAVCSTNGPSNKDMEKLLVMSVETDLGTPKIVMKIQQQCVVNRSRHNILTLYILQVSTDPVRYLCYDTQHNMVVKGTKTNRKQNLEEVVIKKTPRNAKQGN
jgi:hypothetical protein